MSQPDCGEDWAACLGLPELPAPPDPRTFEPDHDHIPAGVFIVTLLVAVLIFDIWALRRRGTRRTRTVSQTTQDWYKRFGWWVAAAVGSLFAVLYWHIIWGF